MGAATLFRCKTLKSRHLNAMSMQPKMPLLVEGTVSCGSSLRESNKETRRMNSSITGRLMLMALCLALAIVAVPVVVLAG